MPMFIYKAVDPKGRVQKGNLEALHLIDLESKLKNQELDLIIAKLAKAGLRKRNKKIGRKNIIDFCVYLEQLISAGVPLLDALIDLRDSLERDGFKDIVATVVEKIEGGEKFSQSLSHFPKVFSEAFVSMIAAGEESGKLDLVLSHLSDSIKWQDEIAAQVKKAITYPLITAVVIFFVVFFLMTFLVPQLVDFIQSMEGRLPFHTKLLINLSNVFVNSWMIILAAPILLVLLVKFTVMQSQRFKIAYDRNKIRLPIFGVIIQKIILARFSYYLSMMYASGITVLRCLEICQSLVGNKAVEKEIDQIRNEIVSGMTIHDAMANSQLFPALTVRMVRVGEQTGKLEDSLQNVSYFYKREIDESIEQLQTLIEPTLTVTMGLMIAWIMLSVLGPLYDLMTTINI